MGPGELDLSKNNNVISDVFAVNTMTGAVMVESMFNQDTKVNVESNSHGISI